MASGILVILDDIASLFDDVATQSKIATKQTVGVLGDDLAVGAQRASGFHASRELPVLWAITKGSFINKLIILPIAFLLSAFLPQLIVPILLLGGIYLSYEGAEKIYEFLFHREHAAPAAKSVTDKKELLSLEKSKIRSAIVTDFILSIEIIIIALSSVADQPIGIQIGAVSFVAIVATIGVYGLVALMVRMDDAGFALVENSREHSGFKAGLLRKTGRTLIAALPKLIRILGVVGTLAMLLVGGGIFVHNLETVHHAIEWMPIILGELLLGLVIGIIALALVLLAKRIFSPKK
ncbi:MULTISPECIES: DUF808 domain-containing protein [Thiomicrorhabdus]|uniref:DUF808 domain-containing protein n=1 Tax=Thiomicrorhabdus heinhorstiae TaxID=2748010 RepID=A0ABS0BTG2_9GAMM|nr:MULTISPECIES: DUF808 family protein [Thiomicrorhabdus]MBF6057070.1 DUF808 domain-containing protein [Thiomicrorhabdus heinhorstiae]